MITIIFAPPRTGKTCFMTHMLCLHAFDRERNRKMQSELLNKIQNGFSNIKTIPLHCVSANYNCTFKKFGYSPRFNRKINPFRLGFANEFVKTHFNLPYEVIGIQEGQQYLNSRMSLYYPDWQSRWYEQHGHDDIKIYLDTQRPYLIDVNVRELSNFTEIVKLEKRFDDFGKIKSLSWKVRKIDNSSLFDRYMASGKKDKSCYSEEIVTANYNVFDCYDSKSCNPKFYEGHFDEDIDYIESSYLDKTYEGYLKYLQQDYDEIPANFFKKRSSKWILIKII